MKAFLKKWWWRSSFLALISILGVAEAQTFQNLVPNGSFETFTQCPNSSSQIYFAAPWTGPTTNSSDYLNACSPGKNVLYYGGVGNSYPYYLKAKHGVAYSGIYVYQPNDYREYVQIKLADTLKSSLCYYVEFYAANIQYVPFAVNNISANLSATSFPSNLNYPGMVVNVPMHITNYGNPVLQDTVKWKKISGVYEASGIEKYLIIGNFKTNSQTDTLRLYKAGTGPVLAAHMAYIFLDAVSVYSINPNGLLPWSYRDTTINKGDSVYIGNKMGGLNFHPKWYNQNGTYIKTNAGITVSPTITTKYVVQYTLCGVQRTDTVKVIVPLDNDVAIKKFNALNENLKIFPNPTTEVLNVDISNSLNVTGMINEETIFRIKIINCMGQIIREEELLFENNTVKIKTDELKEGVYILQLKSTLGVVNRRFQIVR